MDKILSWLATAVLIILLSYILPGVYVAGFLTALLLALVLGLINMIIKPVLIVLTLPINILTLGLFTLVINAFLVMLAAALVPGFQVAGFWTALFFSLILSLATSWLGLKK